MAAGVSAQFDGAPAIHRDMRPLPRRRRQGRPPDRPVRTNPIDFSDCRLASGEADADWALVITRGGLVAGHSPEMPPFAVLSAAQVNELVRYLRGFCREPGWPSGNLNLTRALFTAKAFPENEVVIEAAVSHGRETFPRQRLQFAYSRRIGRRASVEVAVPAETVSAPQGRHTGIGDIEMSGKYVVFAGRERPFILSAGLDVTFATGSQRWGFGEGTHVAEPFLAMGTSWRAIQLQADVAAILPARRFPTEPIRHVIYNAAVSTRLTHVPHHWTVGLETNGVDGALWLTPFVARDITKRGGLSAAFGVRLPVRPPYPYESDAIRWTGYLLWDYLEPLRSQSK